MVPFLVRFPSVRVGYLLEVALCSEPLADRMFSPARWASLLGYSAEVLLELGLVAHAAGSWPVRTSVL